MTNMMGNSVTVLSASTGRLVTVIDDPSYEFSRRVPLPWVAMTSGWSMLMATLSLCCRLRLEDLSR